MISEKMKNLGQKRSTIREIFEYANARRKEIGASNVYDFSLGNPSIPAPKKVEEIIKKLLDEKGAVALHGYTSAPGDPVVRQKISDYIFNTFSAPCTPNNIYMTCGAAASLTISLSAVCNANDEVIVLAPFFPEYKVFIEQAGATPIIVKNKLPDFSLDFNALEKAINSKTKAIIINSPNNPTGKIISEAEIIELSKLLNKKQKEYSSQIFLIADEPYRELVYGDNKPCYVPNYYDNTIVCYSFSKSLSLPGERIGYIFVSPKVVGSSDVYSAVCGAGRSLGYVCAPSMFQYVVSECLGTSSDVTEYEKNRNLFYDFLTKTGYEVVSPDGAFYLFVKALEDDATAFCERAKKYEIMLVPSNDFGVNGYVRISYCVANKTIQDSLPKFKALYDEYSK